MWRMLIGIRCSQGEAGGSSEEVAAPAEMGRSAEEAWLACEDVVARGFMKNPPQGDLRLLLDVVCKVQPRGLSKCKEDGTILQCGLCSQSRKIRFFC